MEILDWTLILGILAAVIWLLYISLNPKKGGCSGCCGCTCGKTISARDPGKRPGRGVKEVRL